MNGTQGVYVRLLVTHEQMKRVEMLENIVLKYALHGEVGHVKARNLFSREELDAITCLVAEVKAEKAGLK